MLFNDILPKNIWLANDSWSCVGEKASFGSVLGRFGSKRPINKRKEWENCRVSEGTFDSKIIQTFRVFVTQPRSFDFFLTISSKYWPSAYIYQCACLVWHAAFLKQTLPLRLASYFPTNEMQINFWLGNKLRWNYTGIASIVLVQCFASYQIPGYVFTGHALYGTMGFQRFQ